MISQLSADHNAVVGVPGVVADWLAGAGDPNVDIPFILSPSPQTHPAWQRAVVRWCRRGGAAWGPTGATDSGSGHHVSVVPPGLGGRVVHSN